MRNRIGIVKEIDRIGRIVIPKEYRERIGLDKELEILLTENGILIRNPEYVLVKKEEMSAQMQNVK
jgi:AbrB family looped-hinge helix DNA binding protein